MKIDELTRTIVAMIVGEIQLEKGTHGISSSDALQEFVKKHDPDLFERALEVVKKKEQDDE